MPKVGIRLKIDVSKIVKNRLFKGDKGVYLDATAFVDLGELDQYGQSGMITQDVSTEERENGVKGAILGNSKVFWSEGLPPKNQGQQQQQPPLRKPNQGMQMPAGDGWDDDIPF